MGCVLTIVNPHSELRNLYNEGSGDERIKHHEQVGKETVRCDHHCRLSTVAVAQKGGKLHYNAAYNSSRIS